MWQGWNEPDQAGICYEELLKRYNLNRYNRIFWVLLYFCMMSMTDSDSIPLSAIQTSPDDCSADFWADHSRTCHAQSYEICLDDALLANTNSRFYCNVWDCNITWAGYICVSDPGIVCEGDDLMKPSCPFCQSASGLGWWNRTIREVPTDQAQVVTPWQQNAITAKGMGYETTSPQIASKIKEWLQPFLGAVCQKPMTCPDWINFHFYIMEVSESKFTKSKNLWCAKSMSVGASVSKWRMTNLGSTQIQSVMLFRQRRLLPSCYSGSVLPTPKQACNGSHFPAPQYRLSVPYILRITNYFDFVDFDPDTSIYIMGCTTDVTGLQEKLQEVLDVVKLYPLLFANMSGSGTRLKLVMLSLDSISTT